MNDLDRITDPIQPASGVRILSGWIEDDGRIGYVDQPVLFFRGGMPHCCAMEKDCIGGEDTGSNYDYALYHPDTRHIDPDGNEESDRDVAIKQLRETLAAKIAARQAVAE